MTDPTMRSIGITGTGYYVPERIMTNDEIATFLDTSDAWIYSKTGIHARRIAAPHEATSDLAVESSRRALQSAGVRVEDVDLIVLATSTPDMIQPSTAAIVQGRLGAVNAAAFDVSAVCAGFAYAMTVAYSMMVANPAYKQVLVIGAETYSRILDWKDRKTCVFFGDGAGAVVLSDVPAGTGVRSTFLMNDGRKADVIHFAAGGSRHPASLETLEKNMHRFVMDGHQVWDFAIKAFPDAVRRVVASAGDRMEDVSLVISHQANINIIRHALEELGLAMDKTFTNLDRYGNTSGASIPIALAEARENRRLAKGDNLVLVGFGGGLSYGAVYLKWSVD